MGIGGTGGAVGTVGRGMATRASLIFRWLPYCAPAGCAPHLDGNGRPKRKGGGTYVLCGTHGKHGLCIVLRGLAVEDLVGSMVSVCALRPYS